MEVWAYEKRVQTILQKCLNRIMRDILGRGPREPVAQMLADLGWLSIPNQVEYRTLFWIRKVERDNSSPFTSSILHVSQTERLTRGWRYKPTFMSQTLATYQLFCHRLASLYLSYNLLPRLLESISISAQILPRESRCCCSGQGLVSRPCGCPPPTRWLGATPGLGWGRPSACHPGTYP